MITQKQNRIGRKNTRTAGTVALACGLALTGCSSGGASAASSSQPTPSLTRLAPGECGTADGKGCAPASQRIDLAAPTFSKPTEITNPLFPIGRLKSVVLLGRIDGKPFRTETTLLPSTGTVTWNGQTFQVLVSQYMAYLDGRLDEVAIDRYAQADDGSVWYLGEDVFDYRNGGVVVTEGTWHAGREGPAAMIMPGKPKVGDVYRPENAPGVVFEEVIVRSVTERVAGPLGQVTGTLLASELHADGTREDKLFAPGYGEFRTASEGDFEALALAVPTDSLDTPLPAALGALTSGAVALLEAARLQNEETAPGLLRRVTAAWAATRAGQPALITQQLSATLTRLTKAVNDSAWPAVAQSAVDLTQSALDLQLRYLPATDVDAARLTLWTQQLRVDAAANNAAGVAGSVAVIEWIRDRITLRPEARQELDARLAGLRVAADAKNLPAAADHAARLGAKMRYLAQPAA